MSARVGRAVPLLATIAALLGGEAVLWRAGHRLPSLSAHGLSRTLVEADPLGVTVSFLRLGALAVGAALLTVTVIGIAARAAGAAHLVVRIDRWTPTSLRALLDGALGAGLAASIGLSSLPAGADPSAAPAVSSPVAPEAPSRDGPILRRLPDTAPGAAATGTTTLRRLSDAALPAAAAGPPEPTSTLPPPPQASPVVAASAGPTATLRRLPDGSPAAEGSPETATTVPGRAHPVPAAQPPTPPDPSASEPPPPADPTPAARPAAASGEVVVRPGDSFWLLAERHQSERLGRQPTEAEVGECWHQLIARNRHRLAVPDDPDLIFPGQVLQLPTL